MKNFLSLLSLELAQELATTGLLKEPLSEIPPIAPCPEGIRQNWCMPLHSGMISNAPPNSFTVLSNHLEDIEWKNGFLNFNLSLEAIGKVLENGPGSYSIPLTHSLRSPELHRDLGGQRQILTRFRKYEKDLVARALETESTYHENLTAPPLPEERQLFNASLWLAYQLESREQPWSPGGLSQSLAPYTQALIQCWEHIRLDGNGNTQLFQERAARWRYQFRTIKAILKEILP